VKKAKCQDLYRTRQNIKKLDSDEPVAENLYYVWFFIRPALRAQRRRRSRVNGLTISQDDDKERNVCCIYRRLSAK
jgi:hypothetical protein